MKTKIMICGASGTGKTTLANHISQEYGIPFITTSAKEIWPEFGFTSHKDAYEKSVIDPILGMKYQVKVLENRIQLLENMDSYVTDRSYIDNLVYMIMSLSPFVSEANTQDMWDICKEEILKVDAIIYTTFNEEVVLEDDNFRINNRFYQDITDNIMDHTIRKLGLYHLTHPYGEGVPKLLTLRNWNFSIRTKIIHRWILGL